MYSESVPSWLTPKPLVNLGGYLAHLYEKLIWTEKDKTMK
jgi:hypothetical protein